MRVLCIGPAGENLARQACVLSGPKDAAGGGAGMGVIMGSKKLKAIAARGSKDITYAHPKEYLDYFKEQIDVLMTHKWIKALGRLGTPLLGRAGAIGGWSAGDPKRSVEERHEAEGLFAENLLPYSVGMAACAGCAVHCRHRHLVTEGRYACRGEGPEAGGLHVVPGHDPEAALYFNDLVNRLGLSTGVGSTVSWAIKLVEEGVIDESVGYPLKKGDNDAVERLINDIAYRRGFGDILADGKFALDRLPPEAAEGMGFLHGAMAAGGANYGNSLVPRSFVFGHLTSSLPGHIHRSRQGIDILRLPAEVLKKLYDGHTISTDMREYEGKAYMIYWHEILYAVCDALGFCRFQTVMCSANCPEYEEYSQLIRLTTGLDMPESYLREVGERLYTQERMLLWRFGYGDRELASTAQLRGDSYVLNGEKHFAQYAHVADVILTLARDEASGEAVWLLVDGGSEGIDVTPVSTTGGDHQCHVTFRDTPVPAANRLPGDGWPVLERTLQRAAVATCGFAAGAANKVLEFTVEYARTRVQFGRPIATFQAVRHRCADMAVEVDGARFITYEAAWGLSEGIPSEMEVSVAKAYVSDAVREVMAHGHQVHGAIGFSEEHPMPLYSRRAKMTEAMFGNANLHRERVAERLGL
ncbi:MAG: acyl-CoA dehydrogenase family protein [Chloroflexi bacterium]|nr:acyl-CoA dehydrogenase family protein [Chloroflexota bacterium]